MQRLLDRKLVAGFGLAVAVLIVVGGVQYAATRRLIENHHWIAHANRVLQELDGAVDSLAGADMAVRGYIATKDETYADAWRRAATGAQTHFQALREFTWDNPAQRQKLDALEPLSAQSLRLLERAVELLRHNDISAARATVLEGAGRKALEDTRAFSAEMKDEELAQLRTRSQAAEAGSRQITSAVLIGTLSAVLLLASAGVLVNLDSIKRSQMERELAHERDLLHTLMDNVPDFIYFKDAASRFTRVNRALAEALGLARPEDAVGKTDFDFFTPEHAREAFADEQEILRSGQPVIAKVEESSRPGRAPIWVSATKMVIRGSGGGDRGTFGLSRDITETRLAEEERNRFFTLSSDLLCVIGCDGRFKRLNPAWTHLLGFAAGDLLNAPYQGVLHPDDREAMEAEVRKLTTSQGPITFENRIRCRDDSYKWFLWNALFVENQQNVYATGRDITERKEMEEALRTSEQRYRVVFESSQGLICTHDLEGTLLSLNPAAAHCLGYEPEELIGRNLREGLMPQVRHLFDEYLANISRHSFARGVMRVISKTGEERIWQYDNSRKEDAAGRPYVVGNAVDITGLKRAEEALRASEEKFRAVSENANDAVVSANQSGRITYWNKSAARIFGYSDQEVLGQPLTMLMPERFRAPHESAMLRFPSTGQGHLIGRTVEMAGQRKDGSEFPLEISLSTWQSREGRFFAGTLRDISDRKEFERTLQEKNIELERASLAKDRFLASMSHELRTPLNAIIGFTGTLLMKLPGPLTEEQARQLQTIRSSARHLLSLINDLLDVAKIGSGKIVLAIEPVVCQSVAEEVRTTLRPLAERKGLELKLIVPESQLVFNTDRRALSQILLNLTSNAIKFTERGQVSIMVSRETDISKSWALFSVQDTGVGIKPEDQPKLFQAFARLERDGRRPEEGTGLGLHVSQKLAELLGGQINFKSEYGKGSTFTLALPESWKKPDQAV
jgi:PAS domain S-box-containing protein